MHSQTAQLGHGNAQHITNQGFSVLNKKKYAFLQVTVYLGEEKNLRT